MTNDALKGRIACEYPEDQRVFIDSLLGALSAEDPSTYVVIDDDPTGGQTVHDVDVYTSWEPEVLETALSRRPKLFYIMTNSRSLTAAQTIRLHEEIMDRLERASVQLNQPVSVISRSDSTLRGHYPQEVDIIKARSGCPDIREILIPFFREGNRYTVDDVHYMVSEGELIPVGESEFSRDKTFGYRASNLKAWIEEKTGGRVKADQVASVHLDMLRTLDFDGIEKALTGEKRHIVVNATCDDDLKVFAIGYLRAARRGFAFVARTAAAWPRVIGRISDRPPLSGTDLKNGREDRGGLVVIGSHVKRTTAQFEALRSGFPELKYIEFNQHTAVDPVLLAAEVHRAAGEAGEAIARGRTCVVYTRRKRMDMDSGDGEDELRVTQRIADAVADIVRRLGVTPRFIISKGGITSSDIAVKALQVRHAVIRGQIAPGIPVWRLDSNCLYPNMDYVIFPGNVGEDETLRDIVAKLIERS